jgi:hypothetical protein
LSSTIATLAGNTGLGSERQIIWAVNSANYWAFGYTGTNVLASWYSSDGASWTAGGTHTLAHAHNSEGRNLAVGYKDIAGVDVVYFSLPWSSSGSIAVNAIRATISGTTITFHTSETAVASGTSDGGSLLWAGTGLEFDSNNKLHLANGFAGGGNGDVNSSDSTADLGTAEQMTPVTWSAHVIDSSVANESRSAYAIDLGSGNAGLIADNGSAHSTTTGIDWHTWNGSSWNIDNTNGKVSGGSISAIDKNDWGAVAVSASDIHAVYRNASGNLVHRRYNGTSWGAGQSIPAQNSLAGGGIALTSDGASVWLCVIDTDVTNTVRYIRWSSITVNGLADTWDTNWQAAELSNQTRTFIGCARDVQAQTGLVYWSEGSDYVAVTFQALPPADPVGAWIQSNQGSTGTAATTFAVTFTTKNIVAGNRIVVAVAAWNSAATTVTSVTDSALNQYAKDKDVVESDGTHLSIWSAPITAGGGTKPTVTAHASGSTAEWAMWVHEYSGLLGGTAGYTDGTNSHVATATSPFTSGASVPAPGAAGEIAFGFYGDGGNNVTTIGVSAGWTQRGTSIQGTASTAEGACEDQITVAGTGSNASFTLSTTGNPAGALVVVYKLALSAIGLGPTDLTGLSPLTLPGSPYESMLWNQPLLIAAPAAPGAPAILPFVFVARQKPTSRRPNSILGSVPPKIILGAPFNSGGIAPVVPTRAIQKPKPAQIKPRIQPGLLGIVPAVSKATQKLTPRRSNSLLGSVPPKVVQAPIYNSGGIAPVAASRAVQKPNPTRAKSRLLIATPTGVLSGTPPIVVKSIQKLRPLRLPPKTIQPAYNSGGITPVTSKAIQKPRPTQLKPRIQQGLLGIVPTVSKANQKLTPRRPNSLSGSIPPRIITAPAFNSGGVPPTAPTRAVQKPVPTRAKSRILIATPTIVVAGTPPILVRAVQKTRPLRLAPKIVRPTYNSGGIRPIVLKGVQKPRPFRLPPKVQPAPKFNSGGIRPTVLIAPRQPAVKPKLSRLVVPGLAYMPVFIRPNPLAYPLQAQATAGIGSSVAATVYGQATYGTSVYDLAFISVLSIPLQAQAQAGASSSGKGSTLAFPLQSSAAANRVV